MRICLVLALCALTGCYGDAAPGAQGVADGQTDANAGVQTDANGGLQPDADAGSQAETTTSSACDDPGLLSGAKATLEASCHACHGKAGATEGGFNYVLDVPKLIQTGKVVPGDAGASNLFTFMSTGYMPKQGFEPQPDDVAIAAVGAWIDCGAEDFAPTAERTFVTTEEVLAAIRADLEAQSVPRRAFTRYFSLVHLYNAGLGDDELQTYRNGISKLVNSLSWGGAVEPPVAIDPPRNTLLRIDTTDYQWHYTHTGEEADLWEAIVATYPYGVRHSDYPDDAAIEALAGTEMPMVTGDWFVFAAARPPLYHTILALPETQAELEALLNVDTRQSIESGLAMRAGFNGSGVSNHNRIIERHEGTRAFWLSYDFGSSGVEDKKNIFSFPLGPQRPDLSDEENAQYFLPDGGEFVFELPNGLYGLLHHRPRGGAHRQGAHRGGQGRGAGGARGAQRLTRASTATTRG